jgi:hypothetical protein
MINMKILKTLLYTLTIAAFFVTGCSRQTGQTLDGNGLVGTWQWVRSDGGFGYHIHDTPASTGKNIELKFLDNSRYAIYTNGAITSQGTYTLENKQCIHDHKAKTFINFSSASDADMMIEKMEGGTLELSDEHFDGIGSIYQRKASGN